MPIGRPADSTPLHDIDRAPLSEASEQARRRATVFFLSLSRPNVLTQALLAGYDEEAHNAGLFLLRIVNAEGSFGDWRRSYARKPAADPDLPELVAELDAFASRWRPITIATADRMKTSDERDEIRRLFAESSEDSRSRVRRARGFVHLLESLENEGFYAPIWEGVVAAGFLAELPRFHEALATVQEFIRNAPVGDAEMATIHASREAMAASLRAWLDGRRTQFADVVGAALDLMGLGEGVPPGNMSPAPTWLFNSFSSDAKA